MTKRVCGICRRERPLEKMLEGQALCADRRKCLSYASNHMVGTKAQSEAKRLSRRAVYGS